MNKFLWGNSTSSMQTEGAYNEGGKGPSVYDIREASRNKSDWKVAIDEYHRYEEDIKLMAEMGINCYRFQISWSRIFPEGEGKINEEGINFYENLIDKLIEYNIEPMICLYHFDMPLSLYEKYDGFSSRHVKDEFVKYGKLMVDRFHEKVKYWITFNEHNLYSMDVGFVIAGSKKEHTLENIYNIQNYTLLAHAEIANYVHDKYKDLQIGGMLAYSPFYPASSRPDDVLIANQYDRFLNKLFIDVFSGRNYPKFFLNYINKNNIALDLTKQDSEELDKLYNDFMSFSYYQSQTVKSNGSEFNTLSLNQIIDNEFLDRSEWNWEIDPIGIRISMENIYADSNIPVFIIENGIGLREELPDDEYIKDEERINYHDSHINEMKKAMKNGVDCIGYLGWGLIDIPSSSGDVEKRYGAIYVNRDNHDLKDLRRIKKKSFEYFKKVYNQNILEEIKYDRNKK